MFPLVGLPWESGWPETQPLILTSLFILLHVISKLYPDKMDGRRGELIGYLREYKYLPMPDTHTKRKN